MSFAELLFADPVGQRGSEGAPVDARALSAWLAMVSGVDLEVAVGEVPSTDGRLLVLPSRLPDPAMARVAGLVQAGLLARGLLGQRPWLVRMHGDWVLRSAWTVLAGRAVLAEECAQLPGIARELESVPERLMVNLVEVPSQGLPGPFRELLDEPPGPAEALSLMGRASRWRERLVGEGLGPCPVPWHLGVVRPEWLLEPQELDEDWRRGQKPLRLLRRAIQRAKGERRPSLERLPAPRSSPRRSREWRGSGWTEVPMLIREAPGGPEARWSEILDANRAAARGLVARFSALRESPRWVGGQVDGSEVDLDRALVALADSRRGLRPDPRLYRRFERPPLPLAVHTLVDLSGSTTGAVLHAEQQAVVLFASALQALGAPFAFTGFNGDAEAAHLWTLKAFGQPLDAGARRRLANLRAAGSTRLGAVVRHGAESLARRPEPRRLLLLLSDGRPQARGYEGPPALDDTAMAVREARRRGVRVVCVSLDPRDTSWLRPLFGEDHRVLRSVESLVERLPELFLESRGS